MGAESLRDAAILAVSHCLLGEDTMGETLTRIARLAVDALPNTQIAGLTMVSDGTIGTHVFTHPDAPAIDRSQYEAGEGPCLEAFRTGRVVDIPSMPEETRWPRFVRAALDGGILSSLSVPIPGPAGPVGAMNLYATVEHGFGPDDVATGLLLVEQASYVLINTAAFLGEQENVVNLRLAMQSRSIIDQAKGIIMGAQHVDAARAFAILVQQSQFENVKLRSVAEAIVRGATRPV
jgi:GAF domain-containing protein